MAEPIEDDENPNPNEHDRDPSNLMMRSGYLRGMALKLPQGHEDRKFLLRASRSLLAYANALRGVS